MLSAETGYVVHWTPISVTLCVVSILLASAAFLGCVILTCWWCVDCNGRNLLQERADSKQRVRDKQYAHEERMAEVEARRYEAMSALVDIQPGVENEPIRHRSSGN